MHSDLVMKERQRLANLLTNERDALIQRWRRQVKELRSARQLDNPTLIDHVPQFITDLACALRTGTTETIAEAVDEARGAANHGMQRALDGFDIVEVVAEYNILRECIHDMAAEQGLVIQGEMFHVINRLLDGAIGSAVQNYSRAQAAEVQRRREEYLAFIAHDLRTPLNAIAMSARLLAHGGAVDVALLQKTMMRNIDQLSSLVSEVLKENSQQENESGVRLERRWFDLWPLIEGLMHELQPIAGNSSTRLVNEVPPELRVYADANIAARIFQNLIANGIAHTAHGEVVIGAQESATGEAVEAWVRDNGTGIPADKLERVFEKYETDHKEEHGAGLGLAIVKTFVEAHGGTVSVQSKAGEGSVFRMTLPNAVGISAAANSQPKEIQP